MAYIYKVTIVEKQTVVELPPGMRLLVRRVCNSVLVRENFNYSADVSVVFVDNDYIQSLNKQYRGKDTPTDMLSFPAVKDGDYEINPETGAKILGDIILSIEKALEEARIYFLPVQDIIMRWTAHSLMHLLGYDHEKRDLDYAKMQQVCDDIINEVSVPEAFCDFRSYKSER